MIEVGKKGRIKASSPYSNFINDVTIYEIVELRDIRTLEESGVDVLLDVFEKVGLGGLEYNLALDNNINIVTLMDTASNLIYVPKTYITKTVDVMTYVYAEKTIGINLGILPEGFNLSLLEQELKDLVELYIGVEPTIKSVTSSKSIGLSEDDNALILTRLQTNNPLSCRAKLIKANITIGDLKCRIKAMNCKIENG